MRPSFEETYIEIAHIFRKRSTCSRGKVGIVLTQGKHIISVAYNGSQPGEPHCDDPGVECDVELNLHGAGCRRTVHAEANAILDCAKRGVSTLGAHAFCTHSPCYNCAKLLVGAGITHFTYTTPYRLVDGLEYLRAHAIVCNQLGRNPRSVFD